MRPTRSTPRDIVHALELAEPPCDHRSITRTIGPIGGVNAVTVSLGAPSPFAMVTVATVPAVKSVWGSSGANDALTTRIEADAVPPVQVFFVCRRTEMMPLTQSTASM